MSLPVPSRAEAIADLQRQLLDDPDPRLSITLVSVLVQFHRRTLQRYVDEGLIKVERIGPKQRIFIRWKQVCAQFPEDTRRIRASVDKLTQAALSNP